MLLFGTSGSICFAFKKSLCEGECFKFFTLIIVRKSSPCTAVQRRFCILYPSIAVIAGLKQITFGFHRESLDCL